MKPQKFPQQKTYFYLTPLAAALSIGLFAPHAYAVTCQAGFTASNPDSSYTDNGNGTVTHTPTGLTWKRCQEGKTWSGGTCTGSATSHTWSQALTLAATANHAGQTDWRLPNIQELTSLVEECRVNPSINDTIFPNTSASLVWSGSPLAHNTSVAWFVFFGNGDSYDDYRYGSHGVRLVRGGQSLAPLTMQTISFGTAPSLQVGDATGTIIATGGNSGNPVTFSSSTPSVCTVDSSTGVVTPLAQGTCTIAANQAGNASYSAAAQVTQDITVGVATSRYAVVGNYPITECVTDTTTGLIWEGKEATGWRAGSNTYTNYDSSYGTTAQIDAATNSIGYLNAVNATPLCGFTGGWRMPTFDELKTLVKTGSSPTIDITWFPNTPASYVWSGSPDALMSSFAWVVYFGNGYSYHGYRNDGFGVRLVRGGQSLAPLGVPACTVSADKSSVVAGNPVILTANCSNSPTTYTWTGTGATSCTTNTCTVTPTTAGTLNYSVQGENAAGVGVAANVGVDVTAAISLQKIEASAAWIAPGETTKILATPKDASLANCTSSNTAVATVNLGEITGIARGNATITCNGISTIAQVRQPWVTDISPKQAMVGVDTVFTVTGQDLTIGDIDFELPNCLGKSIRTFDLPSVGWTLDKLLDKETLYFTCMPATVGNFVAKINAPSNPRINFADKRFATGLSPTLFSGGTDCASNNSCAVEFVMAGTKLDGAALANVIDAILKPYTVNGSVPWWSLSSAQLQAIGREFAKYGVSTQRPLAWVDAYNKEISVLEAERIKAVTDMAGVCAVNGCTWRDAWRPSLYTGWVSTTWNAYTGQQWLELAGGILLNGALAVSDAAGIGGALEVTKFGKYANATLGKLGKIQSITKLAKWGKRLNAAQKLGAMLEVGSAGLSTWSQQDNADFQETLKEMKLKGVEIVGSELLSQFLATGSGKMNEDIAKITAKFITAATLQTIQDAVKEKDSASAADIKSIGDALSGVGDVALESAISATPILSAWVDMGKLSADIADRAYKSYFGNVDNLNDVFHGRANQVQHRYQIQNLIRLYSQAHAISGSENLNTNPPVLAGGLPQAWGNNNFAATVKRMALVTHGWNASGMDWPSDYVTLTCQRLNAPVTTEITSNTPHVTGISQWCKAGDLLVAAYNWNDGAELWNYRDATNINLQPVRPPSSALANAQALGRALGDGLTKSGIRPDFIHLIAHSAGSGLIEEVAGQIKANNPQSIRHQTFLDAYCPEPSNCSYGMNGTWAEQYVHAGDEFGVGTITTTLLNGIPDGIAAAMYGKDQTGVTLPNAYSFDVTSLFSTSNPIAGHAYPYNIYLKSAGSTNVSAKHLTKIAAHLAQEFGSQTPLLTLARTYPAGTRCWIPDGNLGTSGRASVVGECEKVESLGGSQPTTISVAPTYQEMYSRCDTPLVPSPSNITASSCLTPIGIISSSTTTRTATAPSNMLSSGNTRMSFNFSTGVNTLSFNYQFVQAPAGSVAQVFVDNQLVFVAHNDVVGTQLKLATNISFPRIEAGLHYVQVVVTSGDSSTAVFSLTNIQYELVNQPVPTIQPLPQIPTPPPTPTPVPVDTSPPPTPTVPADGNIGNTASSGGDLLVIGNTTLKAGSNGGQIQATGVAGTSTVAVTSGSVGIPCTVAGNFCKSGQTTLPVLAGESVKFTADGKVSSIQITPPTPISSPTRLNGKTLVDAIIATIQAHVPVLGAVTERNVADWNALMFGFSSGKLSVAAQLPMQVNPALADGVSLLPNGTVQVTTQGVVVNLAPSLVDSGSFTTALQTLNPNAQVRFGTDGTMGISYNQQLFSLRPSLFIANSDSSQFTVGKDDGILRFDNQSIPPAPYSFDQFSTMLATVDATARVSVQADGKLVVLWKGTPYMLIPDYQVFVATTPNPIGFVIRDGKLVVNYQFGFSQGFSVDVKTNR
jgi:hypothetical protein